MTSVRVRRATAEDFDRVAALTVDAYASDGQLAVEVGYDRLLADVPSRAAAAEVLVAEIDDGAVVGSASRRPSEERARRRRSIVGAVAFALPGSPYAEMCGARAIVICTRDFTVTAHRLYERLGFVRTPERDWSPLPGVDLLAFRLDLSARRSSADEVEGDVERGGSAQVVGDVRIADDEPAGVQGEDRQR